MTFRWSVAALFLVLLPHGAGAQEGAPADWTGTHVGLLAGGMRSAGEAVRDAFTGDLIELDIGNGLFPARREDDDLAGVAGAGIGYTVQRGAFAGGIELDLMLSGVEADARFTRVDPNTDPLFNGVITTTGYRTEIDGLATLRLRAGLLRGRSLLYATGGVAAGRVANRFSLDLPNLSSIPGGYSNTWSESGTRFGLVVGAGIEQKLGARTSLKAELLHFDLEDVTIHAEDPPIFADNSLDYRFRNDGQILRVGLNLRF